MSELCREAQVSRAGFYRHWQAHAPRAEQGEVRDRLQELALAHRHYGYRRLTALLKQEGHAINHKRVAHLLRTDNLLAVRRRRYIVTTDARHTWRIYPNLAPWVKPDGPNQLWVADITYLRLREEFAFLAVILDVWSRRVVGWAVRDQLDTHLTLEALRQALARREVLPGLIHHSDRGVQYACSDYMAELEKHHIIASMSRPGNPYDNAYCESFIGKLKQEQWDGRDYRTVAEVRPDMETMLERVYNEQRLHSALGYLTPAAYEERNQGAASPSRSMIRQAQARVQATLRASLRLGLDTDPAPPKTN